MLFQKVFKGSSRPTDPYKTYRLNVWKKNKLPIVIHTKFHEKWDAGKQIKTNNPNPGRNTISYHQKSHIYSIIHAEKLF